MTPPASPVPGSLPPEGVSSTTARFRDGASWEASAGYSRAARSGAFIAVSGTTAPGGAQSDPGDTYSQTTACLRRVIEAVEALGGNEFEIVRTRILLVPGADVEAASRAHKDLLGHVEPANSLYFVAGLVGAGLLVEVEADAVVGPGLDR